MAIFVFPPSKSGKRKRQQRRELVALQRQVSILKQELQKAKNANAVLKAKRSKRGLDMEIDQVKHDLHLLKNALSEIFGKLPERTKKSISDSTKSILGFE